MSRNAGRESCPFRFICSGSTISTLLHDRINPKDCQVLFLGDTGFLQFFRVVSRDYGKPRCWLHLGPQERWPIDLLKGDALRTMHKKHQKLPDTGCSWFQHFILCFSLLDLRVALHDFIIFKCESTQVLHQQNFLGHSHFLWGAADAKPSPAKSVQVNNCPVVPPVDTQQPLKRTDKSIHLVDLLTKVDCSPWLL